jgi:hypothetical protein
MEPTGGRLERKGGFSYSLYSSEEETRIRLLKEKLGIEDGTNVEDGLHAKDDTNVELGLQSKIPSSKLTSLLIIISLE